MNRITDELLRRQNALRSSKVRKWRARARAVKGGGGPTLFPFITRAVAQDALTNATPINFTVTFTEAVTGFTNADINFTGSTVGGTLSAAITGTGPYNVAVTGMTGEGLVQIFIPAGSVLDSATGLVLNAVSNTASVQYDGTAPSVTINKASGQADPTSTSPILFTVVFSEPVLGFLASDISFTGSTATGTLSASLSGTGPTYTISVTGMTGDGNVVASVPAAVCTDLAGNSNTVSTFTDKTVAWVQPDVTSPSVTVDKGSGQSDPTSSSPIIFDVVFSETVTGLTNSDIDLSASTTGGTLVASISGFGPTYTISVSGMAMPDGNVIASIPAGVAIDGSGNPNLASTSTDNIVAWTVAAAFPDNSTSANELPLLFV